MHPLIHYTSTFFLCAFAWSRNALTWPGLATAFVVATAHGYHQWSAFYGLLAVFFLGGTYVTKIGKAKKESATMTSQTASPGAARRGYIQVLANSGIAAVFIILHYFFLKERLAQVPHFHINRAPSGCLPVPTQTIKATERFDFRAALANALPYGIVVSYAAAAADTASSELGMLSSATPVLLPGLFTGRIVRVPRGTNGGVTVLGIAVGAAAAALIGLFAAATLPLCDVHGDPREMVATHIDGRAEAWSQRGSLTWTKEAQWGWLVAYVTVAGTIGSLIDSLLGAWFQASVVDTETGKVIEDAHGGKVSVIEGDDSSVKDKPARRVIVGRDLLSNNGVNLLMNAIVSCGSVVVLAIWSQGKAS